MDDVFEMGDPRYAAQVMPELFPKERQPVLKNWSEQDREMFCGEYTSLRRGTIQAEALLADTFQGAMRIRRAS